MPFNAAQSQAALTPCFVGARKPMADYVALIGLEKLQTTLTAITAPRLTRLAQAFPPDLLRALVRDMNTPELTRIGGMSLNSLQSLLAIDVQWMKAMLRVIGGPHPAYATAQFDVPNPPPGAIRNTHGALEMTSTQPTLANTVLTETAVVGGPAVRNLIFNAAGNCIAEVNFANHGGTATSGHAHVYPVMCIPHTGHHAMGTPHINPADYPAVWIALPAGVAAARAIGT